MQVIKDHNIAELAPTIVLDKPAQNGLHYQACDFVLNLVKQDCSPIKIFKDLVAGRVKVRWS